jgi:hypothetical protein
MSSGMLGALGGEEFDRLSTASGTESDDDETVF